MKNRLYLVHTAEKDLKKELGLKIAKPGITNTMILIPSNANKSISTLRRLDLLSSIDIFEHLTMKNIRWLLDSLVGETFMPGEAVNLNSTIFFRLSKKDRSVINFISSKVVWLEFLVLKKEMSILKFIINK